jgi:hypothetical protein
MLSSTQQRHACYKTDGQQRKLIVRARSTFKCEGEISLAGTGPKPTFAFVNSEYKADKLIQCSGIFVQPINIRSSSRLLYVRELAK